MKTMTAAELKKLTVAELKEIAADLFDADDLKGLKKANLVDLLNDHYTKQAAEDEIDDELDDDELDDDEEPEFRDTAAGDDDLEPIDELDDELDDEDEVDEPRIKIVAETGDTPKTKAAAKTAPPEPSGETLTAKQVATRIGTDAKTLRKFFRSPASTTEAVGQGGRYEFAKDDLPQIKEEFEKWNSTKTTRTARGPKAEKPTRNSKPAVEEIDEVDEELELDGPEDDELDDEDTLTLDFDEVDDDDELDD